MRANLFESSNTPERRGGYGLRAGKNSGKPHKGRDGQGIGSGWKTIAGRGPGGHAARNLCREGDCEESTRRKGPAAFQVF